MKNLFSAEHRDIVERIVHYLDNCSYGRLRLSSRTIYDICLQSFNNKKKLMFQELISRTAIIYSDVNRYTYNAGSPYFNLGHLSASTWGISHAPNFNIRLRDWLSSSVYQTIADRAGAGVPIRVMWRVDALSVPVN